MAWHLGEDFRRDSATWAYNKCLDWHESDKSLPDFLSETIDCPCTMEQARADTGRFHVRYLQTISVVIIEYLVHGIVIHFIVYF